MKRRHSLKPFVSFPRKRESSPRSSRRSIKSRMTSGFSLVELIVVMSIIMTLIGLITINLAGTQQKFSLNTVVQSLISDIRQQQIKAMVGDTEGEPSANSYGLHIDSDQYVLFRGTSYDAMEPSNFAVSLPSNIQFVSPGSDIIFSRINGEYTNAATLSQALMGYWDFDEGTGQSVKDSSVNGNDGTRGIDSSVAPDDPTWTLGKPGLGGALSFNGTNNWVNIPSPNPSPFLSTTSPFTISLWVNKTSGTTGYRNLVSIPFSGTDGFEILITDVSIHEPLAFGSRVSSSFTVFRKAPATGDHTDYDSVWTHIVLTYNGSGGTTMGNFALYENGTPQTLAISSTFGNFSPTFAIGSAFGATNFWRGLLDEVSIYNRALTAAEVKSLYGQVQLEDTTISNTKTIEINMYGVITSVN